MNKLIAILMNSLVHLPLLLILLWVAYRKFISKKPLPEILAIPGRLFRMLLIIVTFGFLAGCSNSDPLAVASGSLFALNAAHWQPTPQALSAPPVVADR